MNIKGKNQHVIPNDTGWCVIDEANQNVVQNFNNQDEAMAYAQKCARECEGEVLLHATPCDPLSISTVSLPQREAIPATGYVNLSEVHSKEGSYGRQQQSTSTKPYGNMQEQRPSSPPRERASDFDPMLGYDEYYFDF